MNNFLAACFVAALSVFWMGTAHAQITITPVDTLDFGSILFASNGSITVSTSGGFSSSGGADHISGGHPAAFSATCTANDSLTISSNMPVTITDLGGNSAANMTISGFTENGAAFCDGAGNLPTFQVGATLTFGSVRPTSGNYNGTFSITIEHP